MFIRKCGQGTEQGLLMIIDHLKNPSITNATNSEIKRLDLRVRGLHHSVQRTWLYYMSTLCLWSWIFPSGQWLFEVGHMALPQCPFSVFSGLSSNLLKVL
jgi:hypothetical protein